MIKELIEFTKEGEVFGGIYYAVTEFHQIDHPVENVCYILEQNMPINTKGEVLQLMANYLIKRDGSVLKDDLPMYRSMIDGRFENPKDIDPEEGILILSLDNLDKLRLTVDDCITIPIEQYERR